jgi:hypothetical protein
MQRFLRRLFFPPAPILCILPTAVFACLIAAAVRGTPSGTSLYILYGLSAYATTLWVLAVPRFLRAVRRARSRVLETRLGGRYLTDVKFHGAVRMAQGLAANLFYVVFRAVSGFLYGSLWFLSLAVYYFLLALIRGCLLLGLRRRGGKADPLAYEYACCRRTAMLLLPLNLAIAVMAAQTVLENEGFVYPGLVIYASAAYTFYTVVRAFVSLARLRKAGSPILSAGAAVGTAEALMSLFGLQTAMMAAFSPDDTALRFRMNAVAGSAVCCAVLLISAVMQIRVRRARRAAECTPEQEDRT